jgi:hypothetical protein
LTTLPNSSDDTQQSTIQQLIDNYANHIIEGLDNDSMEIMLFDLITAEYADYTEEQIVGEMTELYGEEYAQDLLESATDVPVA